jgi:hypothetical protein
VWAGAVGGSTVAGIAGAAAWITIRRHTASLGAPPACLPACLQVCDCVSELAAGIIEDQGWPELLPFIFQCVQSGEWVSEAGSRGGQRERWCS